MALWGTLVNVVLILLGSVAGLVFRRGIPDRLQKPLLQGIGLVVIIFGIGMALDFSDPLVLLLSIVLGTALGEGLRFEERLETFTNRFGERFGGQSGVSQALISSSMVFCAGSMAIMGALQGGLEGRHDILLTKAVLDGICSLLFAASMGPGVALAAIVVLLYQGAIAISAGGLAYLLSGAMLTEINAVGGVLLLAIGLGLADIKRVRVNAMLPALAMPMVIIALQGLFSHGLFR